MGPVWDDSVLQTLDRGGDDGQNQVRLRLSAAALSAGRPVRTSCGS